MICKSIEYKLNFSAENKLLFYFRDGAGPVGVFCVLHNVLQQLRMDKEVDIFTAARQIQTRRPEVISKLVNLLNIKLNLQRKI